MKKSSFYAPNGQGRNSNHKYAKKGNIFAYLKKTGDDVGYVPPHTDLPTKMPIGSAEKIEVLRWRVEEGMELWNDDDAVDWSGLKSADYSIKVSNR